MKKTPLPCLLAVLCAASAPAASFTWDGSEFATSTNWGTAANWSGNAVPDNDGTATLIFNQSPTPGSFASAVNTDYNINKLTITSQSTPFTFTGSAITFSGSGAAITATTASGNATGTANSISNNIVLNAALTINRGVSSSNAARINISGTISGSNAITTGFDNGFLRLSGANTFTGGITNGRGNLEIGHNSALGTGALTLSGTSAAAVSLVGGAKVIANALNISGVASGTGATTFTGDLTINGAVTLNGTAGANTKLTTLGSGAKLTLNGNIGESGTLGKSFRVNASSTGSTGTLVLNGNATYTGATQFGSIETSSRTVFLNGDFSSSSSTQLNAGMTLRGVGTAAAITVAANATLFPGGTDTVETALGTLNVDGNVTFNEGSTFKLNLAAAGASDSINLTGGNVSIVTEGAGAILALNITGGYATLSGTSYTLASFDTIVGSYGTFASITLNGAASSLVDLNNAGYNLVYGTDGIYLQSSSIPEPATVGLLLGLGALGLVATRRRMKAGRQS